MNKIHLRNHSPMPRTPPIRRPKPACIVPANPLQILSIHGHGGASATVSP